MQRSDKRVAKFYASKTWEKVRRAYKIYRHGLCERCGRPGEIVHHKHYINTANIYDPETTMSFDNLELLCRDCHNKEHFLLFDDQGQIKPKQEDMLELAGVYVK